MQAFIQYSRQFTQPLTQVASMANLLQSGVASAERVFELLDAAEQEPDAEHPATLADAARPGRASRTCRSATTPDTPADRATSSLVAEPGQTVAIVGPTGAGKTTLVNLVMRFYELDGGRITLDGVDIADHARATTCAAEIGMVLQDTWLFGGTIRDNIAYGRPGRHRGGDPRGRPGDLRRPLRALAARRLRHGDRRGGRATVSAGERQLITIARAFLADPALLILDEATSSVDTRTEVLRPARDGGAALRPHAASSSPTGSPRSATPT